MKLVNIGVRIFRRYARRFQHLLDHRLIQMADRPFVGLNRWIMEAIFQLRLLIVLILDGLHGTVRIWEGREVDTGQPFRVAYLSDTHALLARSPEYLESILFQPGSVRVEKGNDFPIAQVRAQAQKFVGQVDLVIVEANPLLRFKPPSSFESRWVILPPLVRMVFRFHPGQSWSEISQIMHAQRKNIKILNRIDGGMRVSRAEEDFDLFFDRMHVPLITERFSSTAQMESRDAMHNSFHQGHLMMIDHQNQPIAGALNVISGSSMFGVGLGVLDGDRRWYSLGAVTAIYYNTIRWCYENGIRYLDIGVVRPFSSDGLFEYKRRWGFQPTRDLWMNREWLFWVPCASPVALNWLNNHPTALSIAASPPTAVTETVAV
jgi:hypothetical protein